MLEWVVLDLGGHEARDMSYVRHEVSTLLVCNLAQSFVVPVSWIRRRAANYDPRLKEICILVEAVIVNQACFWIDLVGKRLKIDGRSADLALWRIGTMSQMATVR